MLFVARLPVFARGGNQTARAPGTLPYSALQQTEHVEVLAGHQSFLISCLHAGSWPVTNVK